MSTRNLGVVSPVPQGQWRNGETYQILSIVTYNKGSFIAKQANSNVEPMVSKDWQNFWLQLTPDITVFENDFNVYKQNTTEKLNEEFESLEENINNQFQNQNENINNQLNSFSKQLELNTNNISALFDINKTNGVMALENAENTEEFRKTNSIGFNPLNYTESTVNAIYGNTVGSKNLFPTYAQIKQKRTSYAGVSMYFQNDCIVIHGTTTKEATDVYNSITLGCTAGSVATHPENAIPTYLLPGTYTLSGVNGGSTSTYNMRITFWYKNEDGTYSSESTGVSGTYTNGSKTFTLNHVIEYIYFYFEILNVPKGETVTYVFRPMLNLGTTALPYSLSFTGAKNAQISAIKSTNINLLPVSTFETVNVNGVEIINNGDGSFTINGTATDNIEVSIYDNLPCFSNQYYIKSTSTSISLQATALYKNGVQQVIEGEFPTKITTQNTLFSRFSSYTDGLINIKILINKNLTFRALRIIPFFGIVGSSNLDTNEQSIMELPVALEMGIYDRVEDKKIIKSTLSYVLSGNQNWQAVEDNSGKTSFITDAPEIFNDLYNFTVNSSTEFFKFSLIYDNTILKLQCDPLYEIDIGIFKSMLDFYETTITVRTNIPQLQDLEFNNKYTVWRLGTEEVLSPLDSDGNTCYDYGANNTITADYYVKGGTE